MLMSLLPVLLCSACLAAWCAGQCNMKCCTVSSLCWHAGQMGESIVAVRVDNSTAIQGNDSTSIQGLIQQLESTLELPENLNHRIASRGDLTI